MRSEEISPLVQGKSPGGVKMAHNVRETLNSILEAFESGNIPEAIAHSMFPSLTFRRASGPFSIG